MEAAVSFILLERSFPMFDNVSASFLILVINSLILSIVLLKERIILPISSSRRENLLIVLLSSSRMTTSPVVATFSIKAESGKSGFTMFDVMFSAKITLTITAITVNKIIINENVVPRL